MVFVLGKKKSYSSHSGITIGIKYTEIKRKNLIPFQKGAFCILHQQQKGESRHILTITPISGYVKIKKCMFTHYKWYSLHLLTKSFIQEELTHMGSFNRLFPPWVTFADKNTPLSLAFEQQNEFHKIKCVIFIPLYPWAKYETIWLDFTLKIVSFSAYYLHIIIFCKNAPWVVGFKTHCFEIKI